MCRDRFTGVWPNKATNIEKKGRNVLSQGTEIVKLIQSEA